MKYFSKMVCKQWFELYPEFLGNPFFISGESYAGVYVPTLASEVAKGIHLSSAFFFLALFCWCMVLNYSSLSGIQAGLKPALNFKVPTVSSPLILSSAWR